MELNMWIITLITFCVLLVENITTLIQSIDNRSGFSILHCIAMFMSISMICTSIVQICILA